MLVRQPRESRRAGWRCAGLAFAAALVLVAGCNAITGLGNYDVYDPTGQGAGGGGGTTTTGSGTTGGGGTTSSGGGGSGGSPDDCQNGVLDPGEEDVDCGGPCPPCPCTGHADCASEACIDDFCAEIVQVAAGAAHACAVLGDGTLYCWGQNDDGQLGDGTTVDHFNPEPVPGLSGVVGVALSRRPDTPTEAHSCAWLDDGTVRCWGRNDYGQLGLSTTGGNEPSPVVVPGLANVAQVSLGRYHTCALETGGTVHCWGRSQRGQVGNDSTATAPSPVSVLTGAAQLALANYVSCARLSSGEARCWGRNDFYQLGVGDTTDRLVPTAVPALAGLSEIAMGKSFGCARSSADSVWCWGDNTAGQLATGDTMDQPVPTSITSLSQIAQLALGLRFGVTTLARGGHGCALHVDATVSCWGRNSNGQLGNGATGANETLPVVVSALSNVAELSLGVDYSCARLASGALRCWGRNLEGQLGTGSAGGNLTVPTPVVWP